METDPGPRQTLDVILRFQIGKLEDTVGIRRVGCHWHPNHWRQVRRRQQQINLAGAARAAQCEGRLAGGHVQIRDGRWHNCHEAGNEV